jgi:hypothetical protein
MKETLHLLIVCLCLPLMALALVASLAVIQPFLLGFIVAGSIFAIVQGVRMGRKDQ